MTVSYNLCVSKATFGGFAKLLFRWKGSIFRSLWRESLMFCTLYVAINATYRHALAPEQRDSFSELVKFGKYFMDVIPFYFIVGFFVSTVTGRWINQFIELPWPDRTIHSVATFVHGSDERSRMIRRTLSRYAVLLQILTFQTVSTAVRRRFPTTQHLVAAGIMTTEERSVFEKVEFPFGKWWLPCHWFTTLAKRARKEGRIKEATLLKMLIEEVLNLRNHCAATIAYDWVGVPLAYTQVATIATYLYALVLLVGTQTLHTPEGSMGFSADYYFPFITIWRFFFSVGWLKVAEQLLNPYGEDDDDFELNWTVDRAVAMAYEVADRHYMMHPKVKKDPFWDVKEIKLPQTLLSAKYMKSPEIGSAVGLEIEEADYLPMDELCEKDDEGNEYRNHSMKKTDVGRQNSSFIRRVLNSKFSQSFRKKSLLKRGVGRSKSYQHGISNPAFSMSEENEERDGACASGNSSPPGTRKSSQVNLVRKSSSPVGKRSPGKFKARHLIYKKQKSYQLDETEMGDEDANGKTTVVWDGTTPELTANNRNSQPPDISVDMDAVEKVEFGDDFEDNSEEPDVPMPPIPEEPSRASSLVSSELISGTFIRRGSGETPSQQQQQGYDRSMDLVSEVSEKLLVYRETATAQDRWKDNQGKGYESCCSAGVSSEELSEGSMDGHEQEGAAASLQDKDVVYITIEQQSDVNSAALQSDKRKEV